MIMLTGDPEFDELLEKCLHTLKTKALDYANEDDRLAELRETAVELKITMKQALGVYMNKHLRSIFKWFRGEELKGEPVEEKFLDIIVYSLLGYKLALEERRVTFPPMMPPLLPSMEFPPQEVKSGLTPGGTCREKPKCPACWSTDCNGCEDIPF